MRGGKERRGCEGRGGETGGEGEGGGGVGVRVLGEGGGC